MRYQVYGYTGRTDRFVTYHAFYIFDELFGSGFSKSRRFQVGLSINVYNRLVMTLIIVTTVIVIFVVILVVFLLVLVVLVIYLPLLLLCF